MQLNQPLEFDSSLWPIFSFAGGPTQLPRTVLQKVKKSFLNYNQSGLSLQEIPSQSKEFDEIFQAACSELRSLYHLDNTQFDIYFGQAGATFIFEEICYNLLGKEDTYSFCNTGHWSEKAIKEAKYIGNLHVPTTCLRNEQGLLYIPPQEEWDYNPNSSFLHYVDNETVEGIEFQSVPKFANQYTITDTSSSFLTKPMDFSKLDILYSHGQKNVGMAGSTITIIRKDIISQRYVTMNFYFKRKKSQLTPYIADFTVREKMLGKTNSLPTMPMYVNSVMFKYIRESGGVEFWNEYSQRRAAKIYKVIDESHGFYFNEIVKEQRSRISIAFNLKYEEKLQQKFLDEAKEEGIIGINGHRSRGGCRVCLYIPISDIGLDKLVDYMERFAQKYEQ